MLQDWLVTQGDASDVRKVEDCRGSHEKETGNVRKKSVKRYSRAAGATKQKIKTTKRGM
jgi:hypothetical protein